MNRIATYVVFGLMLLVRSLAVHSQDMVSFATGGYASGLRTQAVMHKMDTNHDNMVSRSEWIAFQKEVFAMLDRNKAGEIDESEYMSGYPAVASFATGGYASGLDARYVQADRRERRRQDIPRRISQLPAQDIRHDGYEPHSPGDARRWPVLRDRWRARSLRRRTAAIASSMVSRTIP